jgi:hypothetical protein
MGMFAEFNPTNPVSMFADTEADARARMLIYLLENRLTSSESESATVLDV